MHTSLLFSELEAEVCAEEEAALVAWRTYDGRERRISAELASRFPMRVDDCKGVDAPVAGDAGEAQMATTKSACVTPSAESFKTAPQDSWTSTHADRNAHGKGAVCSVKPRLPAPLTQQGLESAMSQLPEGSRTTIQSLLTTWKSGRLSDRDLVDTVGSFASGSVAIRDLFVSGDAVCGEVASRADVEQLALMAQQQV